MAERSPFTAEVFIDPAVPPEQEQLLVDRLRALGMSARTKLTPVRRGPTELQWLVLIALPLQAFLGGIGNKLADDAYQAFTAAVRRLLGRGPRPARPLVLQDTTTGLQIVLDSDLPEDAYKQLHQLDLGKFRLGPIHFDQQQRRWRSELDEAQQTPE